MNENFPSGSQPPEWPSHSWDDPDAERSLLKLRLLRYRLGFSALGLALVVASLTTIGFLIMFFSGQRQPIGVLLGIPHWDLIEQSVVVFGSLLGVMLLWGRWPDENWQRRSGLLLMMCLVDAVLWGLENAADLGLHDGELGHKWFRDSLGTAIGWSEFALIASLAADMAAHLGEPQSIDFAKAVRSLATTGAMVWFMYFYFLTSWQTPVWPLRQRPFNGGTIMLLLGWLVLTAILLVQVTGLCLLAGRCWRPGPPRDGGRGPGQRPASLPFRDGMGRLQPLLGLIRPEARRFEVAIGGRSSRSDLGSGKWTLSSRTHSSTIVAANWA